MRLATADPQALSLADPSEMFSTLVAVSLPPPPVVCPPRGRSPGPGAARLMFTGFSEKP
jgi:hypothetical protein